jgi:Putative polyhydroxyalkanoic acid system protein (PHA_gran_rgn)
MSKPLIVSIPHSLGKAEALRRIKSGLGSVRTNYGTVLHIEEETWTGDRMAFRVSALGQHASGNIDVRESDVQLEVTLPWLLHKIAERITPTIRKEGVLMLEKK